MRHAFALLVGKLARLVIRMSGYGSGITWPGELAIRIDPDFIKNSLNPAIKRIVIVGTNGKTTTAKMIETILNREGRRVRRNDSGANLTNGIAGCLLSDTGFLSGQKSEVYVLETDEAVFPLVSEVLKPDIVVFLNLFRDQLDRYGEVDSLAKKWQKAVSRLPDTTRLVANADDPHIAAIASCSGHDAPVYFGLEDRSLGGNGGPEHAADSIFCPECGTSLTYGVVYFSHLGKWACGKCRFTHPVPAVTAAMVEAVLPGTYNLYNTMAAYAVGKLLDVSYEASARALSGFRPAFGRGETVRYGKRDLRILLSKNPTGANEALKTVLGASGPVLILLNDRIPDGTDVSWIWDVDYEVLSGANRRILVSGDRAYDLAVRLFYAGVSLDPDDVIPDPKGAVTKLAAVTGSDETAYILPTYSAMLEIRKLTTGRKIL